MATDEELLALAQAAAPGVNNIGAAPQAEDPPMARQVPAGTPGAVEGPIVAPQDNPVDLGAGGPPPVQYAEAAPQVADAENNPAPAPIAAAAESFTAPSLKTGKPTMATAAEASNQATQAGFDQAKAQAGVGAAKGQERDANAKILDTQGQELHRQQTEMDAKVAAIQVGREKAQATTDKAQEEFHDYKFHKFFSDATTPERLLAGLFVGLGAGSAATTGHNPALEIMDARFKQDFEQQKAELGQKERYAEMKEKGQGSAEVGFRASLAELQLKQAAASDALAAEAKAQLLRNGATVEQAENNVVVQKYKAEALKGRAEAQEKLQAAYATQAMAGAHLALARETAEGNRDAKKAAAETKAQDLLDSSEIPDASGNLIGHAATDRASLRAATAHRERVGANTELQALLDEAKEHVKKFGNHVNPVTDSQAYTDRESIWSRLENQIGKITKISPTDHGMKLSAADLGPRGEWNTRGVSIEHLNEFGADANRQVDEGAKALVTKRSKAAEASNKTPAAPHTKTAPASGGTRIKLKDGRTGTVMPGGAFYPDA